MPSEHTLNGTGWNASDFGGAPSPSEVEVECDDCETVTTSDEMDDWHTTADFEAGETTTLCPDCGCDDDDDGGECLA